MHRARRSLWLVALMLWQTLAWVSPLAIETRAEQMAHLTVHQQDRDHHHHDDASLHLSSDADSEAHFHVDDGSQPPALDTPAAVPAFDGPTDPAPTARPAQPPTGYPDGLLRPPSQRA